MRSSSHLISPRISVPGDQPSNLPSRQAVSLPLASVPTYSHPASSLTHRIHSPAPLINPRSETLTSDHPTRSNIKSPGTRRTPKRKNNSPSRALCVQQHPHPTPPRKELQHPSNTPPFLSKTSQVPAAAPRDPPIAAPHRNILIQSRPPSPPTTTTSPATREPGGVKSSKHTRTSRPFPIVEGAPIPVDFIVPF